MYRRRGSTGVNANSSRSHAVLQIDLRHKHQDDKLARCGLSTALLVFLLLLTAIIVQKRKFNVFICLEAIFEAGELL